MLLKKVLWTLGIGLGLWVGVRYVLPVIAPFLLGMLLALAAEPMVQLGQSKLKLSRSLSAGLGVTVALVFLLAVAILLGSLALRELRALAQDLPDMQSAAASGLQQLRAWLDGAVQNTPQSVRGLLSKSVDISLKDGTAFMQQVTAKIPGAVTGMLSAIPKGALTVFTGVLSAFMFSARLPRLKKTVHAKLPDRWHEKYLPALVCLRQGLWGWLKAQGKLMLVTWGIVGLGLVVLGVDKGILWAGLIALVDAFPVLGTGTIMIPWALFSIFQGKGVFGVGILGVYAVALIVRTALEPKLIGKHLGIDPLVSLVAFYTGFALWGFPGMLLAPILAAAIGTALKNKEA